MKTETLVKHLNEILQVDTIADSSLNGLQVDNSGEVNTVALAVDVSASSIDLAIDAGADMLLVHHGLFWGEALAVTGGHYNRLKKMLKNDLALYAVHLPLDSHPELGNNAQIASLMNWTLGEPFGIYHGMMLGFEIELQRADKLENIAKRLGERLSCKPIVWNFGPENIKRIAYVSGGSMGNLEEAIDKEFDLFITGEPKHTVYWTAQEAQINVICAGHYATETLGVKAVGDYLEKKMGLNTVFIDLPTGH